MSEIKSHVEFDIDDQKNNTFEWVKLEEVIGGNSHLTYPIYKEFCDVNGIVCFEPTERIKTQYLAWSLDKVRVTTLNELGLESDCILNWEIPEKELIKWKKITTEESLANLQELLPVLELIYTKLESARKDLFKNEINNLPYNLEMNTKLWEEELKHWISSNNKDAGSYFWPLRTTLSGKSKSPSPFEILAILDWKEIESRIKKVLI
jgi:glutamyl/glutaminyl-tRNA synthetase